MPPRLVIAALVDQLNRDGPSLQDQAPVNLGIFNIKPYLAELDGTPGREWIVMLKTPAADYRYDGLGLWQALDELPGQGYRRIGEPIIARPYMGLDTFAVRDLTGDGLSDLITTGGMVGFGEAATDFNIYQWMGSGFKLMTNFAHFQDLASEENGSGSHFSLIEDAYPALQLKVDVNQPWNCVYQEIYTLRWPDGVPQRIKSTTLDPHSPACLLGHVSPGYNISNGSLAEVFSLLDRAIAGFNPLNQATLPALSYAHYEMALLEAIRGNDAQARRHVTLMAQELAEDPATVSYLKSRLEGLLSLPRIPAADLCSLGYNAPEETFHTWWAGFRYPGFIAVTDSICSPGAVLDLTVKNLSTAGDGSPKDLLMTSGLQVQSQQEIRLPGTQKTFWLAIVDLGTDSHLVIGLVPTESGPHWEILDSFYQVKGQPLWLNSDVNGDGAPEIAAALPSTEQGNCAPEEQAYQVWIAGRFLPAHAHYASTRIDICQPSGQALDLEALFADANGDGLSDRLVKELSGYFSAQTAELPAWPEGKTFWYKDLEVIGKFSATQKTEDPILSALLNGADPAKTRVDLLSLRERLRANPPGRHYDAQIAYLLALSYELQGQDELAVQGYFDLAHAASRSLWSSLAAARIQHK